MQLKLSEAAQVPPLAVVKDLMRRFEEEATYQAGMPADVLNSIHNIVQGILIGLVAKLQVISIPFLFPLLQSMCTDFILPP